MMVRKINKFLLTAALLSSVGGFSAQAAEIETNTAHMQAMDKITGRVSEIDVPVNSLVRFGSFSILVRKCVTRTPEETPENTAFVDVVDDYDNKEPVNIFKGWVFSSSPALNAIEHPIYDVWLLKCINKDLKDVKKLSEDELRARDEIKMVRGEEKAEEADDDKKAEAKAETSELAKMVEDTIKDGGESAEDKPTSENTDKADAKAAPEMIEVVVSTPEDDATTTDEEAPQALIQIQTQPQAPEQEATAETTMSEDKVKEATDEEAPAPAQEADEVVEFEDENGFYEP